MLKLIERLSVNRRIVILGFGLEGQSSLRFLLTGHFNNEIAVVDRNAEIKKHQLIIENNIQSFGGKDYLLYLKKDDFIIKSPGVKLGEEFKGFEIHSQTSLFLEKFPNHIIGITGTKGKSTTSTMIYQILKKQNCDVFLVGNIGQPAFDLVSQIKPHTKIVYELSAHQLQCVNHGPKYAILLNLMPEHLDFFINKEYYYKAKLQIFNNQPNDHFAYVSPSFQEIATSFKSLNFSENKSIISQHQIKLNEEFVLEPADLKYLLGEHHIQNIHALVELVLHLKLDLEMAIDSIKNFHPLPHRQELLGDKNGLRFINDSISTIPQSAIQAVKAVGKVDYLILGGLDRGVDYSSLIEFLAETSLIKVFFLGDAGRRIHRELVEIEKHLKFRYSISDKLQDIKNELLEIKKGTVLLSPAAASYDAFKNFEARGDYFRKVFEKNI